MGFVEQLATAQEFIRNAQERQALNADTRCSTITFEPGYLVLVDLHALRGSQEGCRPMDMPRAG